MEQTDNQIINKDYIGVVLENDNGLLEFSKIPIDRNPIYGKILQLVNENTASIYEMQNVFKREYPEEKPLDYIWPNEYYQAYINDTKYPKFYDDIDFHLLEPLKLLEAECGRKIIMDCYHNICNKLNMKFNNTEDIFIKYLYKKVQKNEYLRYIYASDYIKSILKIAAQKNAIMFSSDTLGFSTFKYVINQDITIFIKSNFGYGSSAYFVCNLQYKDVDILPYTAIVNYYLVNWTDFLQCTRDYPPIRISWHFLFEYVVRISNLIKTDLQGFKNEILGEIKTMIKGIESIFSTPDIAFRKWLNLKDSDFDASRIHVFRLVRNVSSIGKEAYKVYPEEKVLAYKVQKITGCLELLDNLNKLEDFIPEINQFRKRIIELNRQISPEILGTISKVETEINEMKSKLDIIKEKFVELSKEMYNNYVKKTHKQIELSKYINDLISFLDSNNKMQDVIPDNQANLFAVKIISNLFNDLSKKIEYRKHFLEVLNNGKARIEKYLS